MKNSLNKNDFYNKYDPYEVTILDMEDFIKYRDSSVVEPQEKRIYNSMYHVISQQDKLPLFEYNQIIPNKFNSTSWSRDEVTRLLRPIFSRWANENAVNYQENSGYAVTITLSPNSNYVVTNYVEAGYLPTAAKQKLSLIHI